MNGLLALAVFGIAGFVTALLTARLRPFLERASMVDVPDARRLHRRAVPRGGGAALAVAVLGLQALFVFGGVTPAGGISAAWLLGGTGFALLGWWDDCRPRPARVRLGLQLGIAAIFVAASMSVHGFAGPAWAVLAAGAVAVVAVVWIVNLFNFMDGADGFAGTQAFLFAGAAVLLLQADNAGAALCATAVAGAALGFLYFNRPPARIFMGDSGSYFLGFQIAALTMAGLVAGQSILPWTIVFMPFLVDATATLLRRMVAGERWWTAHRSHAYQILILRGWSSRRLLCSLAALNVFGCWPLAAWAVFDADAAPYATLLAVGLTGMIWVMVNRGRHDEPTDLR